MNVLGYELVNDEKVRRAQEGTVTRGGSLTGGVGENATPEALVAEYDRLGGLILKGGLKVKTGSFYDIQGKKPRPEPVVVFISEIDGQIVEVSEDEAKAIKIAKEKTKQIREKNAEKDEDEPKLKRKRIKMSDPRDAE